MITIRRMEDLGEAIRVRRKELGYTQAFVASYAGVSAELENGKKTIQMDKMLLVVNLLGMDLLIERRG